MNDEEIKQATEKVIIEMLTESTGKAFMDSGDAYGRHWEENQKNGIMTGYQECDFYIDKEAKTCELLPVIPIFDAFKNTLQYTEKCKYLESFIPPHMVSSEPLFWIEEEVEQGKMYDKYQTPFKENDYIGTKVNNSYNSEDFLSQGYMSIFFKHDDESYVAISIHNGCDIRGGYTNVHIFNCEYEDDFFNTHCDVSIDCLHTDGKIHICESGYQMYGRKEYYSYSEQKDVDEHYIYQNTYVDDNGKLRCKECNGLIVCSALGMI